MMRCLLFALVLALCAGAAQGFPTKPVRVILANPPGGTTDALARALAEGLAKNFAQPFVLENRPGANGSIAGQAVLAAEADAHTLLLGPPGPLALNRLLYAAMPFDPRAAFAPVSLVAIAPLVLVVHPGLPVRSVEQFIRYAKEHPGKISYASQGNGSMGHLAMELLRLRTGIAVEHVPYKGSGPALVDLLGGQTHAMFDNTTSSLPHVRSAKLRALAVAEKSRLEAAPEIPTVAESGVPGFEATPWFGVVARAGSPKEAVDALAGAIARILRQPEVEARFAALGVQLVGSSPAELGAHIDAELAKWEPVVKRSGAKLD